MFCVGGVDMKIDREEKRSLKKLLVGILVAAMVVTMLPVGDNALGVAKAETTKFDQTIFGEVEPISVASEDDFNRALSSVSDALNQTVMIQVTKPITFTKNIVFPAGNIAIDLGTNTISVSYISFTKSEAGSNIAFYGDKESAILGDSTGSIDGKTCFCELSQDYLINLQINGEVDLKNVRFEARKGNQLLINGKNLSVTEEGYVRHYQQDNYSCINANQASVIYEELGENFINVYTDEIDETKKFDIYNFEMFPNSEILEAYYVKGAIPADVKIDYQGVAFENINQETDIVEDKELGLYHKTTDTEIVVDAFNLDSNSNNNIYFRSIDNNDAYLEITGSYWEIIDSRGYTKATIAESAIPQSVSDSDGTMEYPVEKVIVTKKEEAFALTEESDRVTLHFDTANDSTPIYVINKSPAIVTISENSDVWIPWDWPQYDDTECAIVLEDGAVMEDEGTYIKAGSKITITPIGDRCINQVLWGSDIMLNSDLVECCTDGTIIITVPNYAINDSFTFSISDMSYGFASSTYMNLPEPVFTETTDSGIPVDYYKEPFTVTSAENYIICDADLATTNADGWTSAGIPATEDGIYEKHYYVMNVSMVADEGTTKMIPSQDYGVRYGLIHNYVLDTTTPTITSVTATDANGNAMTLDGGWLGEYDTVSAETVWTNTSSITLKATANAGSGLPVAGYMFDGENWQTSNTYTYTGDGVYDVAIHARDEFDVKLEAANKTRPETGIWVSSVGIDTTAPKLMFTDGKNATACELKSNAQYEGNLHVVCDDGEGSGFASINLYKKNGSEWTLSNELLIATEDASFIAPTTQNEVYKLEVTDIAGNTNVYENITVVGYVQDVEITVGDVTGVYGEDLEIEVTVKNISENPLSISAFGLREDATDDVFEMEANVVTELASGESFTTKILIAKGANAGDYTAMLDMEYINMDADAGQRVSKVNSQQITATIEKAAGTASVSVENITYGQTPEVTVASTTNGTYNVTIYYKPAAAEDSEYTKEAPENAGEYKVKAVFAATANYNEVEATAEFTIAKATGTGTVSVENLYYGQTVSTTVSSDTNGTDNVTVYFKRAEEDDSTYTTEAPRRVGTYKVKAVFAETANYTELVVEGEFTITRISETRGMYSISSPNRDGVYEGPVVITGMDGNLVSVSEQNGFKEQIVLNGSIEFFRFFIKTPDGAITEAVILRNIVIKEPPVKVTAGRAHLDTGAAYELGEGTWNVSGDSTNYVGGTVFYVPESGDYEFTQQEGGQ